MIHTRANLNPLACPDNQRFVADFHGSFARQDVEKLPGLTMIMSRFAGAGGHRFLNDAQGFTVHETPPVALFSPDIMWSVGGMNRVH